MDAQFGPAHRVLAAALVADRANRRGDRGVRAGDDGAARSPCSPTWLAHALAVRGDTRARGRDPGAARARWRTGTSRRTTARCVHGAGIATDAAVALLHAALRGARSVDRQPRRRAAIRAAARRSAIRRSRGAAWDCEMGNTDRPPRARPARRRPRSGRLGCRPATLRARARSTATSVRALERAITNGTLTPGSRLPAERQLAIALKVSRATVVSAYRELEARGLVRGYVGRGTFVSAAPDSSGAPFAWRGKVAAAALRSTDSRHARSRPRFERSGADVAGGRRPGARDVSRRRVSPIARSRAAPRRPSVWGQAPPRDSRRCARRSRADSAASRKTSSCSPAHSRGSICSRAVSSIPATPSSIDRPGYLGAIHTFRAAGARLVGWDVVRHDLDELEDLLVRYRPKLIYTNPTFQNPTGWTMPIRLRRDFLALAGRLRVPIIEDDTYRELLLRHRAAALAALARHAVGRDLPEQLLEGARAGASPRLAVGGRADRRTARAHQAARRSAHAEPGAVDRRGSHRGRHVRPAPRRAAHRASPAARRARRGARSATARPATCSGRCPTAGCTLWCRLPPRVNSATC